MMGTKDWTDTALVECLSDNLPLSDEQRAILVTLVVQRAKQDKDADRYRWLRSADNDVAGIIRPNGIGWQMLVGGNLDAAIDAAMATAPAVGAA